MRIYAALCSRRGCSQVLFLGILSPHIYDQLEVATWGGCDLLDGCQTCFQRKSRCSTPALPVIRRNYEYVEYNLIHTSTTNAKATILPQPRPAPVRTYSHHHHPETSNYEKKSQSSPLYAPQFTHDPCLSVYHPPLAPLCTVWTIASVSVWAMRSGLTSFGLDVALLLVAAVISQSVNEVT